ncbi:hypothetical protein, variant 3 [Phytophthora nicotianae CJ01A1]|uniref:Uncharacterized protein n=7 Tax=Phytophthora nicotianae TaxID=4792 RepID=V9FDH4_PHYNI|nr:hypothetical protein F443_06666 [Phytophthora nicotianae P1569]ETO78231.1 hypothetical protein F444_06737 [Phytophthora nicotianae P1976]ETP19268.1 hypothetical protein F441_06673 [Phytophthora nicotianae CJ01A1]ETI49510.1 hypothetical protein, variant 1 [Phytophthora nicotianae P1569]ETI49511.1 hypothetical protein, variant 2 [Phytophthora nicotianae P1569]
MGWVYGCALSKYRDWTLHFVGMEGGRRKGDDPTSGAVRQGEGAIVVASYRAFFCLAKNTASLEMQNHTKASCDVMIIAIDYNNVSVVFAWHQSIYCVFSLLKH